VCEFTVLSHRLRADFSSRTTTKSPEATQSSRKGDSVKRTKEVNVHLFYQIKSSVLQPKPLMFKKKGLIENKSALRKALAKVLKEYSSK
jgi:hypothetical protein